MVSISDAVCMYSVDKVVDAARQKIKITMATKRKYDNTWLVFVNIRAKANFNFVDLIDVGKKNLDVKYSGAWANIIVKSCIINEAIEIIHQGLNELNFEVVFIDKIENMASLIEYDEVNKKLKSEVNWLIKSNFVFKISDRLFPYE